MQNQCQHVYTVTRRYTIEFRDAWDYEYSTWILQLNLSQSQSDTGCQVNVLLFLSQLVNLMDVLPLHFSSHSSPRMVDIARECDEEDKSATKLVKALKKMTVGSTWKAKM